MSLRPKILKSGIHQDTRGKLTFFNTFDMSGIKRLYLIEHLDSNIIRAWQGHRKEQKWFIAVSGVFEIALVKPDDWQRPSKILVPVIFKLSAGNPQVLYVPGGYATGFQALEEHSKLLVFSDATVTDSMKDDFRFEKDLWSVPWG